MVLWKICKNKCLSALGKPIGHLSAIGQPIWSYRRLGGRLVAPHKCKNSHVKVFRADRHIGIPRADWHRTTLSAFLYLISRRLGHSRYSGVQSFLSIPFTFTMLVYFVTFAFTGTTVACAFWHLDASVGIQQRDGSWVLMELDIGSRTLTPMNARTQA